MSRPALLLATSARLAREDAVALAEHGDLAAMMAAARARRDDAHGTIISYSPKVFIPLTTACRNSCGYCAFRQRPRRAASVYLGRDEALAIARAGQAAGCHEALITLGDQPETRYATARAGLAALGHPTTLSYVAEIAGTVLAETGLLPHLNPGVMTADEIAALRPVSLSMGMMLETIADRLRTKSGPHFNAPDKRAAPRLACIRAAGEAAVPFTSGVLVGIGETRVERIDALLALRDLADAHGHIQEIIVQNFTPKPGTRMADAPPAPLDEHLWTIAIARLIFDADMNIQAPPNLAPQHLGQLIAAGINDWGGISPVTPDHVNPEAPWPTLDVLARATAAAGKMLAPRLPLYPRYVREAACWVDPALHTRTLRVTDGDGWPRSNDWTAGSNTALPEADMAMLAAPSRQAGNLSTIIDACIAGREPGETDIVALFRARGPEFADIAAAADAQRAAQNGAIATYVVNRNINYTNICSVHCAFCAFAKGSTAQHLRGKPFDLAPERIAEQELVGRDQTSIAAQVRDAWTRGATEVCMQGGIHPNYTANTYLDILRTAKAAAPGIHIHAFSPLEVHHGATASGLSLAEYLTALKEAGLGSLPGTAAEVLDDEVRGHLCPDKITTARWLEIVRAAHGVGLRTTATIMFGHIDGYRHWARHLLHIRRLQAETGGITEFVPLPFVPMETPIYLKGQARRGPTFRETVLMHAVARLVLSPLVPNIQASWVKLGAEGLRACLQAGANDMGGTVMHESITRSAGADHGQEMTPRKLKAIATALGRKPRQRTTLYGNVPRRQAQS